MSKKTTDIVAYLTWIGLLIAFLAGDRRGSRFHLNQALVLTVVQVVWNVIFRIVYFLLSSLFLMGTLLGAINTIVSLVLLVFNILGLVYAIQGTEKPLPLIGGIQLYR